MAGIRQDIDDVKAAGKEQTVLGKWIGRVFGGAGLLFLLFLFYKMFMNRMAG